jgi:hypothetical protein
MSSLHNQLTSFIDQSPSWKAGSRSASQEIRLHRPVSWDMNSVRTLPPNALNIHFSNIPQLHQDLPSGLFHSEIPTKMLHAFLISDIRATRPACLSSSSSQALSLFGSNQPTEMVFFHADHLLQTNINLDLLVN